MLRGLCEQLAALGHDIHVIGCYPIQAARIETVNSVKVHRLPGRFGRLGLLVDRFALYQRISQIAAEGIIDIIEAPDFEAPTAFLPCQSRRRVVRLHGSHVYFAHERHQSPSPSVAFLEKAALKQADAWISVSDYTARRTRDLFSLDKPVYTVHNAAHVPARFARKSDYTEVKRALYFGTLAEKKGVLTLARAWRDFSLKHPDWSLMLMGRDALHEGRSVREGMLELLGSQSASVQFTSAVSNQELLEALPGFDFAILPSFSEAFAMAPMEAMALGVPVIFTRLSSGPELIQHGVDGWLTDPRDPADLTQLLEEVAASRDLRAQVATAGRLKIEREFSHEAFVQKNLTVYQQILDSRI